MVIGFEAFREAFKGYEDCYTIIGGTACDILMNKENLDFRATRDIDMILCGCKIYSVFLYFSCTLPLD